MKDKVLTLTDKGWQPTGAEIDEGRGWRMPKQGPSFLWLAINQILKFFTCGIIVSGWVLVGVMLGLHDSKLGWFIFISSYIHVILSKFVFQWP